MGLEYKTRLRIFPGQERNLIRRSYAQMDQTLHGDCMAVELGCLCAALDGVPVTSAILDFTVDNKVGEEPRGRSALFRQIVESIGEVFWMMDPTTGRAAYISPAFEQIWGISCESMYRDPLVWNSAIHLDDRAQAVAAFGEMVRGNPMTSEYRIIRRDGSVRFIRDRGFPVRDAAGRVICIAGVAEDVTQYKESSGRARHALGPVIAGWLSPI